MPHELSTKVVDVLLSNIEPGSTVLEIGTGYGTEALARHYNVISIEDNAEYHTGHSKLIHAPLVPTGVESRSFAKHYPKHSPVWYDVEVIRRSIADITYHAIIVDGPSGPRSRPWFAWFYSNGLFDTEVPVIIDDVHRASDWSMARSVASTQGTDVIRVFDLCNTHKNGNFALISSGVE